MTGFVGLSANATFSGSGGKVPLHDWSCLTNVFPRPSLGSRLLVGESNVTSLSHVHNTLVQCTGCKGRCTMQIRSTVVCDAIKVAYLLVV